VLFSVAYDREKGGLPHPSYQDTKNAASWHAGVRTQIGALDAELSRHPDFAAHTGTDDQRTSPWPSSNFINAKYHRWPSHSA
jgi:hypothetical protein